MVTALTVKLNDGINEQSHTIKIAAIGKYPFITTDHKSFNFDPLLVGKNETSCLTITN